MCRRERLTLGGTLVADAADDVVAQLAALLEHRDELVGLGVVTDEHHAAGQLALGAAALDGLTDDLPLDGHEHEHAQAGGQEPATGERDLEDDRDAGQQDHTHERGVDQPAELLDAS